MFAQFTLPFSAFKPQKFRPSDKPLQAHRACPLSCSDNEQELFSLSNFQFFNDQNGLNRITHRVVFNRDSGILYTNPCYTPYGMQVLFEKCGQSYVHSPETLKDQAQWVETSCSDAASVCDIGCNEGALLNLLPEIWQKMGVDIDAHTLEIARERYPDVQFFQQDLAVAPLDQNADVFLLLDVLEHLPQPLETLQSLRKMATSKSRLLIEVPLLDLTPTASTGDIVGFFSVQHLTHFTRSTLKTLLLNAGWQIESAYDCPGYNGHRVVCRPVEAVNICLTEEEKAAVLMQAKTYVMQWRQNHQNVNQKLNALPPTGPVMIWGAGQHSEYLVHTTQLFQPPNRQFVFVDTDPLKTGTTTHGIPVFHPDQISQDYWPHSTTPIVISTYGSQERVAETLLKKGVPEHLIIKLYDHIHTY